MNGDVEREEIEKLLPWYVTGKIDAADRIRVETYLSQHPAVHAQLEDIRAERDETIRVNEELGYPPAEMVQQLMASLPDTRSRSHAPTARLPTIFDAFSARSVRWAALVGGMILIAQTGVIAGLLMRGGDRIYHVAAGPAMPDGSFSALIVFVDEAKVASVARLLVDFDANIVDGPKPGGVYKIRLRAHSQLPGTQDKLLRELAERRDVIRVVLPGGG
jgi:hypothetical protein